MVAELMATKVTRLYQRGSSGAGAGSPRSGDASSSGTVKVRRET
jgi:hypothetical protein